MNELTIQNLVKEGKSIRQIAKENNLGVSTVKYYFDKYGIKSRFQKFFKRGTCRECLVPLDEYNTYKNNWGICKSCQNKNGQVRFVAQKKRMIEYAGGACKKCGYNKFYGALEFHHLDPSKKDFRLGASNKGWEKLKVEMDKCELLCANCHREEHHRINNL